MGHSYPISWALYHLSCIISFVIFSIIFVICILNYNDPTSITFRITVFILLILSLFGTIKTGIMLKRKKIIYKDKNTSSSTIENS